MESLVWEEKSELIDKRISHQVAYQGCVSLSVVGNNNVFIGRVAEWLRCGLQIHLRGFDSLLGLQTILGV